MKSCVQELIEELALRIFLAGFCRQRQKPKHTSTRLPKICNTFLLASIKSITIDIPNPVSKAYIKSDSAAPSPVTKPDQRPLFSVRWIHNIPIGPIGADTNMPMANPRIIVYSVKSIQSKLSYSSGTIRKRECKYSTSRVQKQIYQSPLWPNHGYISRKYTR